MGIFHMQCYFYPYFSLIIKSKVESKRVLISPLQSDLFQKQGSTYNTKKPKKQRNLCVCPLFKQFKKIFPRSYATFERGATSRKKGRMRWQQVKNEDVNVEIPDHQLCLTTKNMVARKIYQ